MMKDCELELNFLRISFFMLCWQALTVAAAISIVCLDFSEICLPHPSTTVSLMFCQFAKFLLKGKTWGHTRQRPAMTDFHHKVTKFWQRFAKCDPCLILLQYAWSTPHYCPSSSRSLSGEATDTIGTSAFPGILLHIISCMISASLESGSFFFIVGPCHRGKSSFSRKRVWWPIIFFCFFLIEKYILTNSQSRTKNNRLKREFSKQSWL